MDLIEPHLKFSPSGLLTPQHWGLILAEGPDAGTFLQGQLTNDVLLLPVGASSFCRLLFCQRPLVGQFCGAEIKQRQVPHGLPPRSCCKPWSSALSMFVMRAKLKLSDASTLYDIRGLLGETALNLPAQL
jgi:tRNA-modifying protein YgfZ